MNLRTRATCAALAAALVAMAGPVLSPVDARAAEPIPTPEVSGPITGGVRTGAPFLATTTDLEAVGYVEEEFFVSGTARRLAAGGADPVTYTTRVLVRRPVDPKAFRGTVLLEWFNVTSTYDLDVAWPSQRAELFRTGGAYVGVSAQAVGVQQSPNSLRAWDPVRYGTLSHPGDDYSYDIVSQVAQALRRPGDVPILGALSVERVIASGASQSASRLTTYVNAVQPVIEPVIDGFLIEQGGGALRADLDVPVIRHSSENEARGTGQADSSNFRLWEVAGSAHSNQTQGDYHRAKLNRDFGMPPGVDWVLSQRDAPGCRNNDFPRHDVMRMTLRAMDRWVRGGPAPATADRILVVDGAIQRDADGNAIGGIRLPAIEVPTASYNNGPACGDVAGSVTGTPTPLLSLAGRMDPFTEDQLRGRYPTKQSYISAVNAAVGRAVDAGFLLPEDGKRIRDEAKA